MKRLACLPVLAAVVLAAGAAHAQDPRTLTTPAAAIPQPVECAVAPRTADELRALGPGGRRPTPSASPQARQSLFIDPATRAEIEAAVRHFIACRNTGDALRVYALYTDDFLRALPTPGGYLVDSPAMLTLLATPAPVRAGYFWPMPTSMRLAVLADGRVSAHLTFQEGGQMIFATTIVFAHRAGVWLIDDMLGRSLPATPAADPEFDPEDLMS